MGRRDKSFHICFSVLVLVLLLLVALEDLLSQSVAGSFTCISVRVQICFLFGTELDELRWSMKTKFNSSGSFSNLGLSIAYASHFRDLSSRTLAG